MMMNIVEILMFLVCVLFSVAYLTVAERKTLAYMQRRLGPNFVGYYGTTQAFADAVKLTLKEMVLPKESNYMILVISPLITLITALMGWVVMPLGPGITLGETNLGITFSLAMGSLGVFGSLLSGWSSNSKYSLLGSIRSTAQLMSYELMLTSIFIMIMMFVSSLNITTMIETQRVVWYCIPLLPTLLMFFMASVAETARPPFDLTESESELVAGYFTEYSGSPFVFFFLAEYSNIILISAFNGYTLLGGYLSFNYSYLFNVLFNDYSYVSFLFEGLINSSAYAIKLVFLMFSFIWVRAAFPRFTYDNLINFCWIMLLPTLFGMFLMMPSTLYIFDSFPTLM
uniref:NADH-ubiquinone oxidoreductase chain 1 n=1 Tax=Yarrowia galli TaxID=197054 RepID=G4U4Z7_9ASCO|nr:NADH dehydrogenase subunit 1 [Yarrowia galli]CCC29049.1 subunit ND1 of proton translocating NADH:ubiquinone oxidoreductase [Yarrowia galli]